MNNKGLAGYETIMYIPRLFYVVLVIVTTFGLIIAFTTNNAYVGNVESHVLIHRLHFSPDGLSKYDSSTGRVLSGVLNIHAIEDSELETVLSGADGTLTVRLETEDKIAYLDKGTYENWQVIAIAYEQDKGLKGSGVKFPYEETRYVYAGRPSILNTVVLTENG